MPKDTTRYACCLLALALGTMPVSAQVYRWVDEQGKVHFGDAPPDTANAEAVEVNTNQNQIPGVQPTTSAPAEAATNAAQEPAVQPAANNPPPLDYRCFMPVDEILESRVRAVYEPIEPTVLTAQQAAGVRALLERAAGNWRGQARELGCSGQEDNPSVRDISYQASSRADWDTRQGRLTLEHQLGTGRGTSRQSRQNGAQFFELGEDALFYFDVRSQGTVSVNRNIALDGNKVEGLHLDGDSMAFTLKRRSVNAAGRSVVRTEIRLLQFQGRELEQIELFFFQNRLTGAHVWRLSR